MPVLELNNISKSYDQKSLVVQNISFSLERDDFLVLLGPSGCGKSTILNMIAGLESVTSGDIFLNGVRINDLSSQNRNIAMVFQNYALYPNMTVWDNIAFPLKNRHMKKSEIINAISQIAETLSIKPLLKKYPSQLSGGEKQRVAIGRALVRKPSLFLLDEPLSNLDTALRNQLRYELFQLKSKVDVPMVYVTHDQVEALTLATSAAIKGSIIFSDFSIKNFAHNWNSLVGTKNFTSSLSNSILVSTLSSVCGVIIASMAGYAFCIFNNRKNKALFLITSFSMMIPTAAIIVPLFLVFKNTGLLNTYFAVIITSMSIPFLVFLFRQNTKLIPIDIIKSARMDGAYELNIFFRIYVPCMKNVYVAALLISFINAWTSVIFPMILLQSQDRFTFAIFLDSLGSLWYADYAVLMLALLVSSLPILIVYFIFQRQIKSLIGGFGL